IDPATGEARPYSGPHGVEAALACLAARGFDNPPPRSPHTVRLVRGPLTVNLEPGAQTEVSGTPFARLEDVARELEDVRAAIGICGREQGFRFCGHGVQPVSQA